MIISTRLQYLAHSSLPSNTYHIHLDPPEISSRQVDFSWQVEPESELFRSHRAFFHYSDLKLRKIDVQVWYAMWFAHIAKALDQSGDHWVLHFPTPVDLTQLTPWATYLEIRNVSVAAEDTTRLRSLEPVTGNAKEEFAVLLGGGKDSLLTLALLSDLYGARHVTSTILGHHPKNSKTHRLRHERQLLKPLSRHTSSPIRYIETSFRHVFRKRSDTQQSGLVLYFATLLPYLTSGKIQTIAFSYEYTLLYVDQSRTPPVFAHHRARAEFTHALAEELSQVYGHEIRIININSSLSKHVAFRLLAQRYPRYLNAIFMCESTLDKDVKWCGECWKCFEYILMCLLEKVPCDIDIDEFMSSARYIRNVFDAAPDLEVNSETGNLKWHPVFGGHAIHYTTLCHSLYCLDMDYVRTVTGSAAAERLTELKRLLGNHPFGIFDKVISSTIRALPLRRKDGLLKLITTTVPAADDENEPFLLRNAWVSLATDISSPLPEPWDQSPPNQQVVR